MSSARDRLLKCMFPSFTGSQEELSKISCMSFWKIFDSVGLRQQPCLTPTSPTNLGDKYSSTLIRYPAYPYMLLIISYARPVMPYLSSLNSRQLLSIVSKNFVKSINATYNGLFLIVTYELYRVFIMNKTSSVRWSGLKPHWLMHHLLEFDIHFSIRLLMMRRNNLPKQLEIIIPR